MTTRSDPAELQLGNLSKAAKAREGCTGAAWVPWVRLPVVLHLLRSALFAAGEFESLLRSTRPGGGRSRRCSPGCPAAAATQRLPAGAHLHRLAVASEWLHLALEEQFNCLLPCNLVAVGRQKRAGDAGTGAGTGLRRRRQPQRQLLRRAVLGSQGALAAASLCPVLSTASKRFQQPDMMPCMCPEDRMAARLRSLSGGSGCSSLPDCIRMHDWRRLCQPKPSKRFELPLSLLNETAAARTDYATLLTAHTMRRAVAAAAATAVAAVGAAELLAAVRQLQDGPTGAAQAGHRRLRLPLPPAWLLPRPSQPTGRHLARAYPGFGFEQARGGLVDGWEPCC